MPRGAICVVGAGSRGIFLHTRTHSAGLGLWATALVAMSKAGKRSACPTIADFCLPAYAKAAALQPDLCLLTSATLPPSHSPACSTDPPGSRRRGRWLGRSISRARRGRAGCRRSRGWCRRLERRSLCRRRGGLDFADVEKGAEAAPIPIDWRDFQNRIPGLDR